MMMQLVPSEILWHRNIHMKLAMLTVALAVILMNYHPAGAAVDAPDVAVVLAVVADVVATLTKAVVEDEVVEVAMAIIMLVLNHTQTHGGLLAFLAK